MRAFHRILPHATHSVHCTHDITMKPILKIKDQLTHHNSLTLRNGKKVSIIIPSRLAKTRTKYVRKNQVPKSTLGAALYAQALAKADKRRDAVEAANAQWQDTINTPLHAEDGDVPLDMPESPDCTVTTPSYSPYDIEDAPAIETPAPTIPVTHPLLDIGDEQRDAIEAMCAM